MQFDGVYFQRLMERMTKWSDMDRETLFKPIQQYRIYAWPLNVLDFFHFLYLTVLTIFNVITIFFCCECDWYLQNLRENVFDFDKILQMSYDMLCICCLFKFLALRPYYDFSLKTKRRINASFSHILMRVCTGNLILFRPQIHFKLQKNKSDLRWSALWNPSAGGILGWWKWILLNNFYK